MRPPGGGRRGGVALAPGPWGHVGSSASKFPSTSGLAGSWNWPGFSSCLLPVSHLQLLAFSYLGSSNFWKRVCNQDMRSSAYTVKFKFWRTSEIYQNLYKPWKVKWKKIAPQLAAWVSEGTGMLWWLQGLLLWRFGVWRSEPAVSLLDSKIVFWMVVRWLVKESFWLSYKHHSCLKHEFTELLRGIANLNTTGNKQEWPPVCYCGLLYVWPLLCSRVRQNVEMNIKSPSPKSLNLGSGV